MMNNNVSGQNLSDILSQINLNLRIFGLYGDASILSLLMRTGIAGAKKISVGNDKIIVNTGDREYIIQKSAITPANLSQSRNERQVWVKNLNGRHR